MAAPGTNQCMFHAGYTSPAWWGHKGFTLIAASDADFLGVALLFSLYALVDLFAVNSNFFGRVDPYPHLIATYTQHCQTDFITNDERLTNSPCQDQHRSPP